MAESWLCISQYLFPGNNILSVYYFVQSNVNNLKLSLTQEKYVLAYCLVHLAPRGNHGKNICNSCVFFKCIEKTQFSLTQRKRCYSLELSKLSFSKFLYIYHNSLMQRAFVSLDGRFRFFVLFCFCFCFATGSLHCDVLPTWIKCNVNKKILGMNYMGLHHHHSAAEQATTSFLQLHRSWAMAYSLPWLSILFMSPRGH